MATTRRSAVADDRALMDDAAEASTGSDGLLAWHAAWPPPLPVGRAVSAVRAPSTPTTAGRDAEAHRNWLDVLLLIGLAGVFLANALVGWLEPTSFVQLAKESRVGEWLRLGSSSWLLPVICVNDFLVGAGLVAAIWMPRSARRLVLAWAGVWLLAVTLLKLTALDAVRSC